MPRSRGFAPTRVNTAIDPDFFKTAELHVHVPVGRDSEGRSVRRRDHGCSAWRRS
ncbi:MAG: hypothetical protein QM736_29215 [Vicinamibacterales bacterium]